MSLRYEIRNFSDFFTNATLNGTLTGHVDRQWDFFGSVFYCVTLVSTIGKLERLINLKFYLKISII